MNNVVINLFALVMDRFARKRQVPALEQTITVFLGLFANNEAALFPALRRFSDDRRWVLRYLTGRELHRFLHDDVDTVANLWFLLAEDENLYVREGAAKGITTAAETHLDLVWRFWEKAFSHPAENVRHTAAMTFLGLWENPSAKERLLGVLPKVEKDSSAKVKSVYETYIVELTGSSQAPPAVGKEYETTADIPVSKKLIDQVVGQEHAVEIIKLAARQKRSVLLIGEPGTGKSMLGQAMSELLPASSLEDVLVETGGRERNVPRVRRLPAGEAERVIRQSEKEAQANVSSLRWVIGFASVVSVFVAVFYYVTRDSPVYLVGGLISLLFLYWFAKSMKPKPTEHIPKLLVNHARTKKAPFIDATGLHAGALLGDVRHDPYQSGGLEAMPHHLVEPGAIHLAHRGVLFIDEVATLSAESQQTLLTAFQEKKLAITGRSPGSSGTMIRTEPVPSDFLMVLAGNLPDVEKIHPALRSRIRGYGYEIYTNTTMDDTAANRYKLAQFIAQEVHRDGKIPHFSKEAVHAVIGQAKEMSPQAGQLTTRFRELGGLIRAAGDLAIQAGYALVQPEHVEQARQLARSLEEQMYGEAKPATEASPAPVAGKVLALCTTRESISQLSVILSDAHPSDEVEIKVAGVSATHPALLPLEAALNRLGLCGRYYTELADKHTQELLEEASLAVLMSMLSAKNGIPLPERTAVCGQVNVMGRVEAIAYFQKKVSAAKRLGIKKIIAPSAHRLKELPPDMEFIWVESVEDVDRALSSMQKEVTLS